MIRGTLIVLGYEMFGGKINPVIYKLAAAYEILHGALLIQDDAIDRSILRRFKKTIYESLGANHYAISQSMVLGDLGFFIAIDILQNLKFSQKQKDLALTLIWQTISNTILGESLDVELSNSKKASKQDIIHMYELKTAHYTFSTPLELGGLLAGANSEKLKSINEFGKNLGIAFQIKNDLDDESGSDIEEGKNTLLWYYAMKNSSQKQKAFLHKYYGKKITEKKFTQIKKTLSECGAKKATEQKIIEYCQKAEKAIPLICSISSHKLLLSSIISKCLNLSQKLPTLKQMQK